MLRKRIGAIVNATATTVVRKLRVRRLAAAGQTGLALYAVLFLWRCPPQSPPPPPNVTVSEFQPNIGRGGRAVAISLYSGDSQVAIAAGASGGLFQTTNGGQTWSHIDSFLPFRMYDVAFSPSFHPQIVIATTQKDGNPNPQANSGGIWASNDRGATWTHIVPPTSCGNAPMEAYGIFFYATDMVFVATDCGLLWNESVGSANWTQTSNWTRIYPAAVMSVHAASFSATGGVATAIDVCLKGGGEDRSVNWGKVWRPAPVTGPDCQSPHSLTGAPTDSNVLFATSGQTVIESDNGGSSWPTNLQAPGDERPAWVETHMSPDMNPSHYVLYYAGFYTNCVLGAVPQNCPTNNWQNLPNSPLDHDVNEIAFDLVAGASNCPVYEVSDFGVLKRGNVEPGQPCGDPAAWTLVGTAEAGFGALQMFQLNGQVYYPVTGGGVNLSGHTNLFFGTMDNLLWGTYDAGVSRWQCLGPPDCTPEGSYLQVGPPVGSLTEVTYDSLDVGLMKKLTLDQTNGALSNEANFTSHTPPGNGTPAFVVAPHTYVEWSGSTLYLTQDDDQSPWIPIGAVPAGLQVWNAIQVVNTPDGPIIYAMVSDQKQNSGLALLTHFLPPPSSPIQFQIPPLGSNGLNGIWGNCFGDYYCAPVFAADPKNYQHVYASDNVQHVVVVTNNGGKSWQPDTVLTNAITGAGVSMVDSNNNSQVHAFAFDPVDSTRILVGTDQAGVFASANGGTTWSRLPNTSNITAISAFFFDDRTNTIYVSTYGRGLWKMTVDWSTVR